MKINSDGTLSLPAMTLSAHQLDDLLKDLALARAQMNPPIAASFDLETVNTLVAETSPALVVHLSGDRRALLALRHQGYGWVVFRLPRRDVAHLAKLLSG